MLGVDNNGILWKLFKLFYSKEHVKNKLMKIYVNKFSEFRSIMNNYKKNYYKLLYRIENAKELISPLEKLYNVKIRYINKIENANNRVYDLLILMERIFSPDIIKLVQSHVGDETHYELNVLINELNLLSVDIKKTYKSTIGKIPVIMIHRYLNIDDLFI